MTSFRARSQPAMAGPEVGALVASAAGLRWRAPELALMMSDQASAAAAEVGDEGVRLRAEVLAVFACNQLGRGAGVGGRAVRALRAAQRIGEQATELLVRVELAACAADASAPRAGLAILLAVLDRDSPAAPTARAAAMVTAADCLARLGGGTDVATLLDTADQLYDTGRSIEPDTVLLRRGVVHAKLAAYHRRRGDHASAESAARDGLALVDGLTDAELDTGQVSGSLTAELVLAMLDSGQVAEAVLAAQPVLRRPARPAGGPAACWLRLALVSRVHLPAGRHALARRLLGEAVADAERNQLDVALAECRQVQAQLHETCAEFGAALYSVRAAYVADRRWRDTAAELRTLLAAEFGPPAAAAELRSALAGVLASHRAEDGSVLLGRTDPFQPARPPRATRTRHALPTPLPVPNAVPSPSNAVPPWPPQPQPDPPHLAAAAAAAMAPQPVLEAHAAMASQPVLGAHRAMAAQPVVEAHAAMAPEPGLDLGAASDSEPEVQTPLMDHVPDEAHPHEAHHHHRRDEPAAAAAYGVGVVPPAFDESTSGAEPSELPGLLTTNGVDRGSGRHRSDVAMADLLAEALVAYQNGQRARMAAAAGAVPLAPPAEESRATRETRETREPPVRKPEPRAARPHVKWIDLPRDLVWQEPGLGGLSSG